MKKTAYIISHSHWDREWFLPLESLRYRLVTLVDEVADLLENKDGFEYFHMDGQTVMLDDYLLVKPDERARMERLVRDGKLRIGPWYMLQDAFLTSSEANVRNLIYGNQDALKFGAVEKIGYFPDTFGIYGQAPQLVKQAGMDAVIFGRGVKPTGFNNQVFESDYTSPFSEMYWQAPDGTRVLGVLLANWYSNGNEIPVDAESAKAFWDKKLGDAESYASTGALLFMNGCDHQPVQVDLPEALDVARELYPDMEFKHSHFAEYVTALQELVPSDDLQVIEGELTNQRTDGWSTLVNTASSRMYLKQANQRVQQLLEKQVEPIAVMASRVGTAYPEEYLKFTWKMLMENQIHDSITGCSLDAVHREMETRFMRAEQAARAMLADSVTRIVRQVDTTTAKLDGEAVPIVVFHTSGYEASRIVTVDVELDRTYFAEMPFEEIPAYLDGLPNVTLEVRDTDGNLVDASVTELGMQFDYELPDRAFRRPYFARRYRLTFVAEQLPKMGFATYFATPVAGKELVSLESDAKHLENQFLQVDIAENGSYAVTCKETGRTFAGLGGYADQGDIGNEYMFKETGDGLRVTTENLTASCVVTEDSAVRKTVEITHVMMLPESADKASFADEKARVVWHPGRMSPRSEKLREFVIRTSLTLEKAGRALKVDVRMENQIEDHRLRAIFPTGTKRETHFADSVFEIVERPNQVSEEWQNPSNDQRQQAFVALGGLMVVNHGLPEYEVNADGSEIRLTLLRANSEIGDWGNFPAPEAQSLGEQVAQFYVMPYKEEELRTEAAKWAYEYQMEPFAVQADSQHDGRLSNREEFAMWQDAPGLIFSSWKRATSQDAEVLRFHNVTKSVQELELLQNMCKTTILEEKVATESAKRWNVAPSEIITWRKEDEK
ncbi:alpha-mannosidase [Listeria booriae]|uniref:Alpha-mannosidase n=1 Tax=Listeria booriae TaxID=1552123 RepID=A0A7X0XB23_9LIST|nr:alpha-mannosidase [Listeria booriae]MBC1490883.1 alpha-mannosidase [Listeria booriae]MBC1502738.1 alpha-mannosidase [Listeria booriae]